MNQLYSAIAIVLVAVVSVIGTWFVARRNKSGRIDTSEAVTLWKESTAMRNALRDELIATKNQLSETTTQLINAISAVTELNQEISAARFETEQAREETRQLRAQIEGVHDEIKTANALTLGALADNIETRRILEIPKEDRTPAENEHVATAGQRIHQEHLPEIPEADKHMTEEDKTTLGEIRGDASDE